MYLSHFYINQVKSVLDNRDFGWLGGIVIKQLYSHLIVDIVCSQKFVHVSKFYNCRMIDLNV